MRYPAILTMEGNNTLAEFPDCPGCQTFAEPGEDIYAQAEDALCGWLEGHLVTGQVPPLPSKDAPELRQGEHLLWIVVPTKLAAKLSVRRARAEAGLTQTQLANMVGISQQAIAKFEHPDENTSLDTLDKIARALHGHFNMDFEPEQADHHAE